VIEANHTVELTRSLYGMCNVPAKLMPFILLVLLQVRGEYSYWLIVESEHWPSAFINNNHTITALTLLLSLLLFYYYQNMLLLYYDMLNANNSMTNISNLSVSLLVDYNS
jgi:hypothetical protein